MAESVKLVRKFHGQSNWHSWKKQLRSVMMAHDLYGYVDGSIKAPAAASNDANSEYKRKLNLQRQ